MPSNLKGTIVRVQRTVLSRIAVSDDDARRCQAAERFTSQTITLREIFVWFATARRVMRRRSARRRKRSGSGRSTVRVSQLAADLSDAPSKATRLIGPLNLNDLLVLELGANEGR